MTADFAHRIRVRYCETDQMGVAHHGSYVDWFEEARTEWMRRRGKTYRQMEEDGDLLQVVAIDIRYRKSVTYDDEIDIAVDVRETGGASVVLGYEVRLKDGGDLVATGTTKLACVGTNGRPKRLPEDLRP